MEAIATENTYASAPGQAWKTTKSVMAAVGMGASRPGRASAAGLGTGIGTRAGWGSVEEG